MEIHTTITLRTDATLIPARDLPDLLAGPMPAPVRTPDHPKPPEAEVAAWAQRAVAWHHARKKFAQALREALAAGRLNVHDPETHRVAPWFKSLAESEWNLGYQLVARDAIASFMRADGIQIEFEAPGAEAEKTDGADNQDARPDGWGADRPPGVPKHQILETDWPLNSRRTLNLKRSLSEPGDWLKPARIRTGGRARGNPSTWDPAILAFCLMERGYAAKHALTRHLQAHYSESLEAWRVLIGPDR